MSNKYDFLIVGAGLYGEYLLMKLKKGKKMFNN